jgi:hypothetical protein
MQRLFETEGYRLEHGEYAQFFPMNRLKVDSAAEIVGMLDSFFRKLPIVSRFSTSFTQVLRRES